VIAKTSINLDLICSSATIPIKRDVLLYRLAEGTIEVQVLFAAAAGFAGFIADFYFREGFTLKPPGRRIIVMTTVKPKAIENRKSVARNYTGMGC
jgi:hypothetical protein